MTANGRDLTGAQNALGQNVLSASYNAQHQPLSVTDALNNSTSYSYTAWGAPLTVTDAQNKTTSFDYSTSGRLTQVRRGTAVLASFSYDAIGRVATQTDAAGLTLTYTYDTLDQATRVTYPDATFASTVYLPGQRGLASSATDRAGRTSAFFYDALDRATGTQDNAGRSTGMSYDADNNRTGLSDAANTLTQWSHDNLGRVTAKSYAGGLGDAFGYDAAGNLTSRRDAQNRTTAYTYDDNDNLTLVNYAGATPDVSFAYDALNRVTQMSDGPGTSGYSYDVLNRVTSVDGPLTNDTLTYAYDSLGRRSGLGVQGAAANVTYGFDTLDRLSSIASAAGTFGYSYQGNSELLTQLNRPNGSYSSFSYDSLQRLTGIGNRTGTTALISGYNYGYDNRDVKTFVERQVETSALQRVNYSYDTVDQLTLEKSTEPTSAINNSFAYDSRGNRTSSTGTTGPVSYTLNALNQLTSYSTTGFGTNSLSYDADGNLTTNAKGVGGSTYTYDEENRLTRIVGVNESTSVNERKSEFSYDGQSRKVISREYVWSTAVNAWSLNSETRRVYDGMDVVQERDGLNNVTVNYTRSGNIGGLLARTTSSGHFYYHYDGGGNVMQLTDAAQVTVAQYSYDAYGNLLSSSGTQAGQPYRYSTKEHHAFFNLYDYGYRLYAPNLGRWLNRDPIRESGGINLYGFVRNDPVNGVDTNGLARVELRWRYVSGPRWWSGNHAFLLVWDTDPNTGEKIGNPTYFGGYKGNGFGQGEALNARYGEYVGPGAKSPGSPDWGYWPGGP